MSGKLDFRERGDEKRKKKVTKGAGKLDVIK
jgi:hypothetical protein